MDKKLEEILEEFDKISSCWDIASSVRPLIKIFLAKKLTEYAKDYALSLLPEEQNNCDKNSDAEAIYYESCFNTCLKQIKDKI